MVIDLFAWLHGLLRRLLGPGAPGVHTGREVDVEPAGPGPAPLLTWSLGTEPFPLQASAATGGLSPATLTVVGTNATGAPVTLQGVSITLLVGEGATGLTPDPGGIGPVPPPGWPAPAVSDPTGAAAWTFLPPQGGGTVSADGSLVFSFNQVQVNRVPGTSQVTVMEGSGGCSPPGCPTQALGVTKFPAGWGTVSFWGPPVPVPQGGSATLGWSGPPGATYQIEYYTPQTGVVVAPAAGQPPFASQGEYPPADAPLSLQQTTTFTLQVSETVAGQPYDAQCQATVTVEIADAVISEFGGTVAGSATAPSLTLAWATRNAVRCEISTVSQELTPGGTWLLEWPLQQSYTLTAWNSANLPTTATWYVPPVIASFGGTVRVTPSPQIEDVALELGWAALLADGCTLSGVGGTLAASGSATVTPGAAAPLATAYTLTAVNGPQNTSATVNVTWGTAVGSFPAPGLLVGVAATPDGRSLLLGNDAPGGFAVIRVDAGTLAQTATSPVLPQVPQPLAVSPDGSRVFVGQYDAGLMVLDGETLQPVGSPSPLVVTGLAVTGDGKRLLASVAGALAVLDAATLEPLGESVPLSPQPQGIAISPDGGRVYVACSLSIGDADGGVAVLDSETLAPVAASPVPLPGAQSVSLSPDGAVVFAMRTTDLNTRGFQGYLSAIDAATLQPTPTDVLIGPNVIAIAAAVDGSRVFACGLDGFTVIVPSAVTPAG